MKKYSEYKDTGLSWCESIPSHWKIKRNKGLFYQRKEKSLDGYGDLLSLSQYKGITLNDSCESGIYRVDSLVGYNKVYQQDIVMNIMLAWNGSTAMSGISGLISPAYAVFYKASEEVCEKYFHYLFKIPSVLKYFEDHSTGIIKSRLRLYPEIFLKLSSLVPPMDEQEKIVAYLDSKISKIDQLIATKRKEIAVLEEYRQGVINKAVTRGLNPDVELKDSGIEWIGEIPSHWDYKRLRHFSSLQNGISESGDFFLSGTPFATYGDIYKNMVLPEILSGVASSSKAQQEMYSIKKGDIFFTRTSETLDDVGISCVCMKDIEKAIFSGFVIRVRPTKKIIYTGFAKYYFRSSFVREYFTSKMNIVIRVSLGQNILKSLPVLLPPMNEQIEIADELDKRVQKFTEAIEAINKQISLLEEYRTRLISDVVTGQIDVR